MAGRGPCLHHLFYQEKEMIKEFALNNLHILRRLTQLTFICLLLLAPSLDLLRYDVAANDLYIFGQVWELGLGSEFYADPTAFGSGYVAIRILLKAILPWVIVLSIFPLLGVLLGRTFCGWACPEGALFELADSITLKLLGRRSIFGAKPNDPPGAKGGKFKYIVLSGIYLFIVPPFFGVMIAGYFIAPARIWQEIITLDPSFGLKAGVIGVSSYMFLSFIFVRHTICKYFCAAGLMQMIFGWASPVAFGIRFEKASFSRCTDCRQCEQVCFMDVKPRGREDINCVNCGECLSVCTRELGADCGLFTYSARHRDGDGHGEKIAPDGCRPVAMK